LKTCTQHIITKILLANFMLIIAILNAQQTKINSLRSLIANAKSDTTKVILLDELALAYRDEKKLDSSILTYKIALTLNEKLNFSLQRQVWEVATIDYMLYEMGNYLESLNYAVRHLALSETLNDIPQKGGAHLVFGHNYKYLGYYSDALNHYFKARDFFSKKGMNNVFTYECIGDVYLKSGHLDSALIYTQLAYDSAVAISDGGFILYSLRVLGDIYFEKGDDIKAMEYYKQYIPGYITYKERNRDLGFVFNGVARIFQKRQQMDSAIFYAKKALANADFYRDQENLFNAGMLLANCYKEKDDHAALEYLNIAIKAKDSMITSDKLKQAQILAYNEQVREKQQAAVEAKEAARRSMIIIIASTLVSITTFLIWYRIRQLRLKYKLILEQKEGEKLKANYEKKLLELEAKALRAQMNPHFIFNCMNSIKSLIQQKDEDKAVSYLTTFSKLLRTILQNSDKREITLFDEIETCRLYTQLESMRFGKKFSYEFVEDETIDLKSIRVPALIIQPFIENAIWHGIVPKEEGGMIAVTIKQTDNAICCIIDDDGIGRETSKQNKFKGEPSTHQSKGVHLTQTRLDLDNALNQRNAIVETTDKKDANGNAAGTTVTLTFTEY
jgi:tetratricopeptide (TPR) repeat protein